MVYRRQFLGYRRDFRQCRQDMFVRDSAGSVGDISGRTGGSYESVGDISGIVGDNSGIVADTLLWIVPKVSPDIVLNIQPPRTFTMLRVHEPDMKLLCSNVIWSRAPCIRGMCGLSAARCSSGPPGRNSPTLPVTYGCRVP